MISVLLQAAAGGDSLSLRWIDQVGLGIVAVCLVLGVWRGLWWQVIRLAGVVASVVLARLLTPRFAPSVQESLPELGEGVVYGVVWFGLFLAGLVLASLLGMLGKQALEAMQLGLVDRAGGAVAGVMTGALLHCALLVAMTGLTTPEWSDDALADSRSALLLNAVSHQAPLFVDSLAAERFFGTGEDDGR
jgi:uncharacterized membrane protein required for colicin V production